MPRERQPVGLHVLLDLHGVSTALLNDDGGLRAGLEGAAREGGAHVVDARFSRFEPQGVSGIVILAESHVTVHTWPELRFAAVDVFTCGAPEIGERVADAVVRYLAPASCERRRLERGPALPLAGEAA